MANNKTEYAPQNFNDQFEEEKRKYQLSSKSEDWKKEIQETEDNLWLEGRIKFLLDYADGNLGTFKKCAENALSLLKSSDHVFERLLMNDKDSSYPCQLDDMVLPKRTKEDFGITKIEQFTFSNKEKGNRDFGWHRLLNDNPDNYSEPRKGSLKKCQEACKKLISGDLVINEPITPNKEVEEWKKLLIDCPALIEYCTGTIIYKVTYSNEKAVYYLSTGNPYKIFGKKNRISELYTRYVYEKLGGKISGWEYVEWAYKDDCKVIDAYIKKDNIVVKHNANGWSAEKIEEDLNKKTIEEIIDDLKNINNVPQQTT